MMLLMGPVPIVTGWLALAAWLEPSEAPPLTSNHVVEHVVRFADKDREPEDRDPESETGALTTTAEATLSQPETRAEVDLAADCRKTAEQVSAQLGEHCEVIVSSPFVVGGNLTRQELNDWVQRTIGPASRAMANCYFDKPPTRPITVLLFRDEDSYNHYASAIFGDEGLSVYGYYKPNLRTLVMNIGTGGGTLVHELTHALIDFDFPDVPDWFNEGLASLHEQCNILTDESGIEGLENWRLAGLQKTIRDGRLRSLETLVHDDDFRGAEVGLNYAQARYFCLYLQRDGNPRGQNVLPEFYRRLREGREADPRGAAAVREAFPDLSWAELDHDFQRWALELQAP